MGRRRTRKRSAPSRRAEGKDEETPKGDSASIGDISTRTAQPIDEDLSRDLGGQTLVTGALPRQTHRSRVAHAFADSQKPGNTF